jgi:hypothetical protein
MVFDYILVIQKVFFLPSEIAFSKKYKSLVNKKNPNTKNALGCVSGCLTAIEACLLMMD